MVFWFCFLITVHSFFWWSIEVSAHTPHDVIDATILSPAYDLDKTLFVAMSDHLRRSTDGGFSWKDIVNGLDNEHPFTSIAISPSFVSDKTLFMASNGDGIYRSNDAGNSWIKVNNGLDNLSIILLSVSPVFYRQTLLAALRTGGLFRTTDGGKNWHKTLDEEKITAIAFFPKTKENHILAGDHIGNLYLSKDRGQTWTLNFKDMDWGNVNAIAISPGFDADNSFFVGTEKMGAFKTIDGGVSFFQVNHGLPTQANIRSFAISPEYLNDNTIFATTWHEAIFCSKDGGLTWKKYEKGITTDQQADTKKYWSPHFRDLKIPGSFQKNRMIFLGGFDGLFRSVNGGETWVQMETMPIRLIMGLSLCAGKNDQLAVGITTYGGGAYTTMTDGQTWEINNMGLVTTRLSDIVFSPNFFSDNMIFSASQGYLLRSIDRGANWEKISLHIKSWKKYVLSALYHLKIPTGKLRNWMLSDYEEGTPFATVIAISPNFALDQTLFFGTRYHGIYKSVDSGKRNEVLWRADGKTVDSLVISHDFSSDKILFAGIRGDGVYKSENGGVTWNHIFKITDTKFPYYVLSISENYKSDKILFVATGAGLYKTMDGGNNWRQVKASAFGKDSNIITVALSPAFKVDKTLLIAVKGKGLFKSHDGGDTFFPLADDLIRNNHVMKYIRFSNRYAVDKTIYAASYEELFRSTDEGFSWELLQRPIRYENHRENILYDGNWKIENGENFSATKISYATSDKAGARLSFVGTGVSWIGTTSGDQGKAQVYIDGTFMSEVDQYKKKQAKMVNLYSVKNLPFGPHEIEIKAMTQRNKDSKGNRIGIDAFDINP